MSQQNVELLRRAFDAWNRRDPDLWRNYATADVEWTPAGPAALEGTAFRGQEQVAAGLRAVWETWDEVRFTEAEVRELGWGLLWLGQVKLRGASSQVDLEQEFAVHAVLRGGKLAAIHAFLSWEDALSAAGAAQQPCPPHG